MLLSIFQCGALCYPKQTENPTNQLTIVLDIYAKRVAFCLELFTSFDSLHECFSNSILVWDVKRNGRGIYYSIILAHLYCDSHADFFGRLICMENKTTIEFCALCEPFRKRGAEFYHFDTDEMEILNGFNTFGFQET